MIPGDAVPIPVRDRLPSRSAHERVGSRPTVTDMVRSFIVAGATELVDNRSGPSGADDPEVVHKTRVATRQLRSNLQAFSPFLEDGEWLKGVRAELGWLAGALGAVRDSDVLFGRIESRYGELDERYRPSALELLSGLEARRADARRDLRAIMQSPRFEALVDQILWATESPPVGPRGAEPASVAVPLLVSKRWAQLRRSVAALPPRPDDAQMHAVRIRAKKCRYMAEIATPVAGRKAARLAQAVKALQTVLGDLNDTAGAQAWLREAPQSPAQGLAAGLIIAAEEREREALLLAWRKAWAKADRPKLVAWLPKL